MGLFATSGSFPAGLTPAPIKSTLASNYLSFNASSGGGTFAAQYLPDVYEKEVERYGNRSVASFLRMVGAEIPSSSDQIVWSEQGRLHLAYTGVKVKANNTASDKTLVIADHAIRVGQTIVVSNASSGTTVGDTVKAYVSSTAVAGEIECELYVGSNWPASFVASSNPTTLTVFVYGSEFAKGSAAMTDSVTAGFEDFSNSPIIIKDKYEVSGSDTAQIGWVEVTTENGASGYLWYLKSEHETRLRFEDYLEMALIEGELAASGSNAAGAGMKGTEGLFAALTSRGNIYQNFSDGKNALSGSGTRDSLADFDEILKNLDKQGAIEENMIFGARAMTLAFDDMLAAQNSYGSGGTSYGVFNNSEDMALTLGFSGFRRGSYDFYKTDWKYLNDAATRGNGGDDIEGVLVPAGTSTVYDQSLGKNIKRPFLHVRYRASEADDRKMKSWITGSVGGVYTSGDDKMEVHFLSERCLCVQGANNFVLFKNVTTS